MRFWTPDGLLRAPTGPLLDVALGLILPCRGLREIKVALTMASPSDNPLKRLIHETNHRSLWQVLGIYLVASWAVLQVVDTLGGVLNLPDSFPSVALAFLVVGLPLVLATAFVQEGGPGGHSGGVEVAGPNAPPSGTSGLFTWRKTFGGGVVAFALATGAQGNVRSTTMRAWDPDEFEDILALMP